MPMVEATLKAGIISDIQAAFPEHRVDGQLDALAEAISSRVLAEVRKMTIVASNSAGAIVVASIT